jgi:hypothetical protein
MTEFDPQETLPESKSRNAAVSRNVEVCYPFGRKHGSLWRGNNSLRSSTMRKTLGTVLFAMSLIGGATVVLAQSSRDLMPVTGTEANRLRTQFGGFRHSFRHRRHAVHASARPRRVARWERRRVASTPRPEVSTPPPPTNLPSQPSASPAQTAAIFWPDAPADLADYLLFANGNYRFWSQGYDTIVGAAFAPSSAEDQRARATRAENRLNFSPSFNIWD